MRFFDLVVRQTGKSAKQEGPDLVGPQQVNDLLVRENRIRSQAAAAQKHENQKRRRAKKKPGRRFAVAPFGMFTRTIQILPRSSRITTMTRTNPTPPLGR